MQNSDCVEDKYSSQNGLDWLTPSCFARNHSKSNSPAKPFIPKIFMNAKRSSSHNSLDSLSSKDGLMASDIAPTMNETVYLVVFYKSNLAKKEGQRTIQSIEDNKIMSKDVESRQREYEENMIKLEMLSSPVVRTIVNDTKAPGSENFTMDDWAELQNILKKNYLILKSEMRLKDMLTKEVDDLLVEYNKLFLKIRENNEKIRKRLDKEDFKDENLAKVLLDPQHYGLGDAGIFVKNLLYTIYEKPQILAAIVKNNYDSSSWKVLEETLCNTFYEDFISDEIYDDDVMRLLVALLEVEFDKAKKHGDLFRTDHFTNKVLTSYLKRNEYKQYVKRVLKAPLLLIVSEPTKLRLDPQEIQRQLTQSARGSQISSAPIHIERRCRFNTEPNLAEALYKDDFMKEVMKRSITDLSYKKNPIPIPKFRKRRISEDSTFLNSNQSLKSSPREEPDSVLFEMVFNPEESAREKIKNKEVTKILDDNLLLLKKHLSSVIQSIFDNLYSMPLGLRVLCKIIYKLSKAKFPNLSEKEYNEILGNYIFRRWIYPNFISPEHNGILNDIHLSKEQISNNLMEIAKVLQTIFNQSLYPATDIKSELNSYISEILPSVSEYFRELIAVNDNVVDRILAKNGPSLYKIKARSICISLYEIQLLCETINKNKEEVSIISPAAVNLVEKILFFDKENKIFGDRVDPTTNSRLKPLQAFVLFHELIFPQHLKSDYLEEFNKLYEFSKSMSDKEKTVTKAKNILKQILLEVENIKELKRISVDGKITLDEILKRCQDVRSYPEYKNFTSRDKVPLSLSAKYLNSLLSSLDESYKANGYYKLYLEMFSEFQKMAYQVDYSASNVKLQLLKAQETLKKGYLNLDEINQKKKKALKRSFVREFIKLIKIPLCITSPSTTRTLVLNQTDGQKNGLKRSNTIPEKISIVLRNEEGCLHERFALAREFASKGVLPSRLHSKSWGNERPSGEDGAAWDDIFNEANYHCETIDEFIHVFGGLPEVREAIRTGEDTYGVSEAITFYYEKINAGAKFGFKNVADDEYSLILDEIENYITKRLYTRVFPTSETEQDKSFYQRCKTLEWINYDHLEIVSRNRCEEMWQYAGELLNGIDMKTTSVGKLESVVECFKAITQVMQLASTREGGVGGADDSLPIMIYVLMKACPKRMQSNLNFINFLRDGAKMLAGEGYCFTQLRSAVLTVESLGPKFLKVDEEEYNRQISARQQKYAFANSPRRLERLLSL